MPQINLEQIISIISTSTEIPKENISINSTSSDFDKWDSIAQVKISLEVEKITKKKIHTSKMGELTSVKSILNYLK